MNNDKDLIRNWDGMSAEDRDAFICQKVIGKTIYTSAVHAGRNEMIVIKHLGIEGDAMERIPPYTSQLEFAWLVVVAMKPLLFRVSECYGGEYYMAEFFDDWENEASVVLNENPAPHGKCKSIAEAICLAAVRALGYSI